MDKLNKYITRENKYEFVYCSNSEMLHHLTQVGRLLDLEVGRSLIFVPNNDVHNALMTSVIKSIDKDERLISVKTMNSMYVFAEINNN